MCYQVTFAYKYGCSVSQTPGTRFSDFVVYGPIRDQEIVAEASKFPNTFRTSSNSCIFTYTKK